MSRPEYLDDVPDGPALTAYDRTHLKLYMRLLDAEAEGADWREIATHLFGIDANATPGTARTLYDRHLSRARWMSEIGYKQLAISSGN
ncbi:DNA -binding domain-containing protein [Asticcacaulis machinosus]|uniref:DUF2285 domain-containing protein n=1 Tax=Asticcacaulis machinosus TaxID=2984211 RepID=A0ABT5HGY5_9CAUL|nr:DUF2285 domain-containing protein [Asticcacaulis machinosus]MDC7675512.1 DUF2285 domain-containing protein [Asticcacaulis machinosus]